MSTFTTNKETVQIRLWKSTYDKIKKIARKNKITLSVAIELMLESAYGLKGK